MFLFYASINLSLKTGKLDNFQDILNDLSTLKTKVCLFPPDSRILSRVFGSIWKYRMQWFSWRTCTVRAAGANLKCRRHELLGALLSIEAGSQRKPAGCEATLCRLVLPWYQLKRNTLCLKSCFPFPDQNVCYLLPVGHLSHKTF